jgi:CheY-like chemotaxis protein/nitrogen-specific signal transduction histidine kinase
MTSHPPHERQLEAEIADLRRRLDESDATLEALRTDPQRDEFLAILAHELRNPLAPATNALHILQLKAPPLPELAWAQEVIATQIQRMTRLIDDLMDVSRITSNKLTLRLERLELSKILEEALTAARPFVEESGHELSVVWPGEPVLLSADLVRMAQVFSNLLNNAAKYTNPGGRIRLVARVEGRDAVVSIRDTGIGISAEMIPRVFELFMQGDRSLSRSHGGLGIGLTLVKRLVEMHGGSVEVRSGGKDQGSEFTVRMPVLVAPEKPKSRPEGRQYATPTSGLRILVVDDNQPSANSLSLVLELAGNETRTAYDGVEAMVAGETFQPDVVLLDLGLPLMDGYETCARMRQQAWGKDLIMVALTGWGRAEDRRRSREAGFDRHVMKPANPIDLMNLLDEMTATRGR